MKNQSENVWAAAQLSYEAPRVEALEVAVEKGFAQSAESNAPQTLTGGTSGTYENW